jgi:hypothetical protein
LKKLVDPLLKDAYAELPKLPRYELWVAVYLFQFVDHSLN